MIKKSGFVKVHQNSFKIGKKIKPHVYYTCKSCFWIIKYIGWK